MKLAANFKMEGRALVRLSTTSNERSQGGLNVVPLSGMIGSKKLPKWCRAASKQLPSSLHDHLDQTSGSRRE